MNTTSLTHQEIRTIIDTPHLVSTSRGFPTVKPRSVGRDMNDMLLKINIDDISDEPKLIYAEISFTIPGHNWLTCRVQNSNNTDIATYDKVYDNIKALIYTRSSDVTFSITFSRKMGRQKLIINEVKYGFISLEMINESLLSKLCNKNYRDTLYDIAQLKTKNIDKSDIYIKWKLFRLLVNNSIEHDDIIYDSELSKEDTKNYEPIKTEDDKEIETVYMKCVHLLTQYNGAMTHLQKKQVVHDEHKQKHNDTVKQIKILENLKSYLNSEISKINTQLKFLEGKSCEVSGESSEDDKELNVDEITLNLKQVQNQYLVYLKNKMYLLK